MSCGFRLCGPYGTGFCWLDPDLAASLTYRPAYWLAHLVQDDLGQDTGYRLREEVGAARWDVFGTANFLTFQPWTASVEYLLGLGLERVAAWDQHLVERFVGVWTRTATGWSAPGMARPARLWSSSATTGPSATGFCSSGWPRPGSTWPSGGASCGSPAPVQHRGRHRPRPRGPRSRTCQLTGPATGRRVEPWHVRRPKDRNGRRRRDGPPAGAAAATSWPRSVPTRSRTRSGGSSPDLLSAGYGCRVDADVVDEHRRGERHRAVGALREGPTHGHADEQEEVVVEDPGLAL